MPYLCMQMRDQHAKPVMLMQRSQPECMRAIAQIMSQWAASKNGRLCKPLPSSCGTAEIGFYFTSGKLAGSVWMDEIPLVRGDDYKPGVPGGWGIPAKT